MQAIADINNQKSITVAIISDTHCQLNPGILEVINQADIAVHAGDIGNASVLQQMRPKSGQVFAVTGNNDHPVMWPPDQAAQLANIPKTVQFKLPGGSIAVEHGDRHDMIKPDHASLRQAFPDARLIVYGHTHKMVIDDETQPWVVNPGAAGYTRTHGGSSCLLLTTCESDWTIEYLHFLDEQV